MRHAIAPWWHTGIVLTIIGAVTLLGISSRDTSTAHGGIPLYLSVIGLEWALFGITYLGTRHRTTLRELIGARWSGREAFVRGALITIAFWLVWEGTDKAMDWLLHSGEPPNVASMLPRTAVEMFFWILLSASAGICEEFVYRAYLQRQFAAITGSTTTAVVLQAVAFGVSHAYQGWKQVVTITVLGALYGVFALWRRSIVPGMASHIWADILSG